MPRGKYDIIAECHSNLNVLGANARLTKGLIDQGRLAEAKVILEDLKKRLDSAAANVQTLIDTWKPE